MLRRRIIPKSVECVLVCLIVVLSLAASVVVGKKESGSGEDDPPSSEDQLGLGAQGAGGGGTPSPPDPFVPVDPPNPPLYLVSNETSPNMTSGSVVLGEALIHAPIPDLIVENVSCTPQTVENGKNVTIEATLSNIAYGFVNLTKVSFYDNNVTESGLIDTTNVTLEGWKGSASVVWQASSPGNHTIYAVADPSDDVEESNESNNQDDSSLTVTRDSIPGKPDLVALPDEIGVSETIIKGTNASVSVTVRNEGSTDQSSITVKVVDTTADKTVDEYVIGSISATGQNTSYVEWQPESLGRNYLEVKVDPYGNITEEEEDNNRAKNGFYVVGPPLNNTNDNGNGNLTWENCNGTEVFDELLVPSGLVYTISACDVLVNGNVTVNGTLKVLNHSSLVLNRSDFTPHVKISTGGELYSSSSNMSAHVFSRGFVFIAYGLLTLIENDVSWTTGKNDYDHSSGIQIYSDNATINKTTIREGRGHGVYVGGTAYGYSIKNSTLESNGYAGARTESGSFGFFTNVTSTENLDGFHFNGAGGQISSSSIHTNCRYGIYNLNSEEVIGDNNISNHKGDCPARMEPIPLYAPPEPPVIANYSKIASGIFGKMSLNNISNTVIKNNTFGIWLIWNASVWVPKYVEYENNDVQHNLIGIRLENVSSSVRIQNNTDISNNTKQGVYISQSNVSHIWHNRIRSNGKEGIRCENGVVRVMDDNEIVNHDYGLVLVGCTNSHVKKTRFFRDSSAEVENHTGIWTSRSSIHVQDVVFESLEFGYYDTNYSTSTIDGGSRFYPKNGSIPSVGVIALGTNTTIVSSSFWYYSSNVCNATTGISESCRAFPVVLRNTPNATIDNSSVKETLFAILAVNSRGSITSNYFGEDTSLGTPTYHTGGVSVHTYLSDDGLRIVNNTFFAGPAQSIRTELSSSPIVRRNNLTGRVFEPGHIFNWNVSSGVNEFYHAAIICYSGSSPLIEYNEITGYTQGISIESGGIGNPSSPTVRFNNLTKTGYLAITTGATATLHDINEPVIDGNNVLFSRGGGIKTESWKNVTISNNTVYHGNGFAYVHASGTNYTHSFGGIYLGLKSVSGESPGQKTIAKNTIIKNNESGIWVARNDGTDVTVDGNYVNWSKQGILIVIGEPVKYEIVSNNHLHNNSEGIAIHRSAHPVLVGNEVFGHKNQTKGIAVYGYSSRSVEYTLTGQRTVHNTTYGIFLWELPRNKTNPNYPKTVNLTGQHNISASYYAVYLNHSAPGFNGVKIQAWAQNEFGLYSVSSSPEVYGSTEFSGNNHTGAYILWSCVKGMPGDPFNCDNPRVYGNSLIEWNGKYGLVFDTVYGEAENIEVSNNSYGLVGGSSSVYVRTSTLRDNYVGMYIVSEQYGTIEANDFISNEYGLYVGGSSPQISENDFFDNTEVAIYANGDSAPLLEYTNITNTGTYIDARYGIYVSGCNENGKSLEIRYAWVNNTNKSLYITDSGKGSDGRILLNYVNVSYATMNSSSDWPIRITASKVNMTGNAEFSIWHTDPTGISLSGNTNVTMKSVNVTVQYSKGNPRALQASSASGSVFITDSSFKLAGTPTGTSDYMVTLNGKDITLDKSTIQNYGTGRDIRVIDGENIIIRENHVISGGTKNEVSFGIVVEGGSVEISNNTEIRGYNSAISISGGDVLVKENDDITGVYRGITVSGGWANITNNTIHDIHHDNGNPSNGAGILIVPNGNARIYDHNEIYNATYGIKVTTSSAQEIFDFNELHDTDYGIYVQGGNVSAHNNTIHHNDYGVYLNTSYAPELSYYNSIHNNTVAGIWLSSNVGAFEGQILWNDIVDNGLGINASDPGGGNYTHCECNWWGDAGGPFDNTTLDIGPPDYNPNTDGEPVSDYFWYRDPPENRTKGWLTGWSNSPSTNCTGGV